MIVAKTKIKKIPEKCAKCKFSRIEHAWGLNSHRVCGILDKLVPYLYNEEKRNWEYTKISDCPLIEIKEGTHE
jgi:hypothetical protein